MAITPKRSGVIALLEDGTEILLVDITSSELINAAKTVSGSADAGIAGMKVTRAALRFSIHKVGDTEVKWADLDDAGMAKHIPRTRDVIRLQKVFGAEHFPTEAQSEAVMASIAVEAGNDQRWTATLPDGRAVVFAECKPATVEAALNEAALSQKSEAARGIASIISGCSRSIRSVGGVAVTESDLKLPGWDAYFSVREMQLLSGVYNYIHGLDGEAPGEVKPVLR